MTCRIAGLLVLSALLIGGLFPVRAHAQVRLLGIDETSGTIESVAKDEIAIKDCRGQGHPGEDSAAGR